VLSRLVSNLIVSQGGRRLVRVEVFPEDVKVQRKLTSGLRAQAGGGVRQAITGLSSDSARRLKFQARNITGMVTLLTLTYPHEFPTDGPTTKNHLRVFCQWLSRQGLGGLWILEFQKRGAPHYHLFLNGRLPYQAINEAWYSIVGSEDPKHLKAGCKVEAIRQPHAMAAYAAKYVAKQEQKDVPEGFEHVGRFWGLFGGVKATPEHVIEGEIGGDGPGPGSPVVCQETGEVLGEVPPGPVQVVRMLRNLMDVQLRKIGRRRRRDNGRFGFTAWGVGGAAARCVPRLCGAT
jgi:hypothetical protein